MLSFALSAGLGALGGALIAPVTGIQYSMGFGIAVKAFAASVLGGLGNVAGAIVGALGLGLLEAFTAGYGSTAYRDVVSYGLLLLVLLALPSGLLGGRAERSHTTAGALG
jgi:branched-chain amino acid transport system permease protein